MFKNAQFNRSHDQIVSELGQGAANYGRVLVIAEDKRGGDPKVWGTGTEQDITQLLKTVAPEFGLREPA